MKYLDECILSLRQKNISHSYIKVKKETFFNDRLIMFLPEKFINMPDELLRTKFMAEELPEYIKMTDNGELTMSLDVMESCNSVEVELDKSRQIIKTLYPKGVIYEEGRIGEIGGWFDSKCFWEKDTYYKLYFIVEKNEIKVFGSFQCKFDKYDKWKPQILNILNQLK